MGKKGLVATIVTGCLIGGGATAALLLGKKKEREMVDVPSEEQPEEYSEEITEEEAE